MSGIGVILFLLGIPIVFFNFMLGQGSTSPLSNSDVIRHIDYLIGFMLIASGAIIVAIQAGNKNSHQESRRLAAIDEIRKNITMPSPPVPVTKQETPADEEAKDMAVYSPPSFRIAALVVVAIVIVFLISYAIFS